MEEGLEGPAIVAIWTSAVYILSPKWVGEGLRICHNPHHTLISNRVYTPDSHDALCERRWQRGRCRRQRIWRCITTRSLVRPRSLLPIGGPCDSILWRVVVKDPSGKQLILRERRLIPRLRDIE